MFGAEKVYIIEVGCVDCGKVCGVGVRRIMYNIMLKYDN